MFFLQFEVSMDKSPLPEKRVLKQKNNPGNYTGKGFSGKSAFKG
jgi:hypothetical protein